MNGLETLSPWQRRLLSICERRGVRVFAAVVGLVSAVCSLAVTLVVMAVLGAPTDQVAVGCGISVVVPLLVAPPIALTVGRLVEVMGELSASLLARSRLDPLTGVLNHRAFTEEAERLVALGTNEVCLTAMLDIDDFKAVNDRWGHATGDDTLHTMAANLTRAVDGVGVVGRLGGDEFAVVARLAGAAELAALQDRLAQAADLSDVREGLGASIGYHVATQTAPIADSLRWADDALYDAKRGRRHGGVRSVLG